MLLRLNFYFCFFLPIVILFVMSCKNNKQDDNDNEHQQKNILITTTFYPIYIFSLNIVEGSDHIRVEKLTNQNTGDLHDYQLTASDLKKLSQSVALVINHHKHENFINKIQKIFPNLIIIESSVDILTPEKEYAPLNKNTTDIKKHRNNQKNNSHHPEILNTHFWISPCFAWQQVKKIANEIAILDSINAKLYEKNSQKYINTLQTLCNNMKKDFAHLSGKKALVYHDAFKYFFEDLSIEIIGEIQTRENKLPTPKELYSLEKKLQITNEPIPIFIEEDHADIGTHVSRNLAQKTGNKIYKLNSITNGNFSLDSYEIITKKNLTIINHAFTESLTPTKTKKNNTTDK